MKRIRMRNQLLSLTSYLILRKEISSVVIKVETNSCVVVQNNGNNFEKNSSSWLENEVGWAEGEQKQDRPKKLNPFKISRLRVTLSLS
jgi:hypothetical protein